VAAFARLMAGLGPFEARPRIAVAVSGGADSLALAILCHRWAKALRGEAIALSVDHRLRPESASEIHQVAHWLTARGIPHHVLVWKRSSARRPAALQAAARTARYDLLARWCRRRGVLHLALAHHAGDQAETTLMRLARGGGADGLAGMSAIASRQGVRLIRPLLPVATARLRATLLAAGQDWIEDPSNSNPTFERVRWRRLIPAGLVPALAAAAAEIGEERGLRERGVADLLANARIHPAGFLSLPLADLTAAADDMAERALARCLIVIGGETYGPRQESLALLRRSLSGSLAGRTLGGCRIVCRDSRLFIFREAAAAKQRVAARAGALIRWDGRFDLRSAMSGTIARLGESGWAKLPAAERSRSIPRDAAIALPALWRSGQPPVPAQIRPGPASGCARFRPGQPLAPNGFTVVKLNVNII
jgi:tRNA(Ile)-lysidine synthase